jgi:uncharacterized protein YgiM (DUF1202 family)
VVDTTRLGADVIPRQSQVVLRAGPSTRADTVLTIVAPSRMQVLGAAQAWYRVRAEDGRSGYLREISVAVAPR